MWESQVGYQVSSEHDDFHLANQLFSECQNTAHSEPSRPVCEKLAVKKRMKNECFMVIYG